MCMFLLLYIKMLCECIAIKTCDKGNRSSEIDTELWNIVKNCKMFERQFIVI